MQRVERKGQEVLELQYKTIGTYFKERVEKTPDHIAVEFEGQKVTWRELDELSDWLVYRFSFLGIHKGTRAAIWCGNHLQWVVVYLGLQKIGALTILVNPGYQAMELFQILSYAQVEYLFYGETFKEMNLSEVLEEIDLTKHPYLKQTIPIEMQDAVDVLVEGAKNLDDAKRAHIEQLKQQVLPEDLACMLFTSGTTALPKGVLLTHYNLVNDARATVEAMRWKEEDRICVTVPLFHCFGITSCLLASIIAGSRLFLMKYYRTATVLEAIEKGKCTVLNGVPSMFLAMIHNPLLGQSDIHTLQSGIIAGSPIDAESYKRICQMLQIQKLQMSYGQTETSPGVSFSAYDDSIEEKCDNAGQLVEHIELCIWDQEGKQHIYPDANCGNPGEIGIRGFLVMAGYYNAPEETDKTLEKDGWLHTGDLGYMDENKRLHVIGRKKEMIIRGGENISPTEIEVCIGTMPEVRQVKVIGVPQKVLQEEIAACVVLERGATLTAQEIQDFVKSKLAYYKVPKYIEFFQKLPVNASGKIKTGELKEQVIQTMQQNGY